MKKLFAIPQVVLLLFILSTTTFAATPETVVPLWDNIDFISVPMVFDGTTGEAKATIYGQSGTTNIIGTLTVYVQGRYDWMVVNSKTDSVNGDLLVIPVQFQAIAGGEYKAELTVSVTRNGTTETETTTTYNTCPIN